MIKQLYKEALTLNRRVCVPLSETVRPSHNRVNKWGRWRRADWSPINRGCWFKKNKNDKIGHKLYLGVRTNKVSVWGSTAERHIMLFTDSRLSLVWQRHRERVLSRIKRSLLDTSKKGVQLQNAKIVPWCRCFWCGRLQPIQHCVHWATENLLKLTSVRGLIPQCKNTSLQVNILVLWFKFGDV